MKPGFAVLAAAGALTLASPSNAALYSFTLTGEYSASWTYDSDPVPDDFDASSFTLWDVEGDFPDAVLGVVDLQFWLASALGGVSVIDFYGGVTLADTTGAQVFSGATSAPTFLLGTYSLEDLSSGDPYTLVISDAAVVPEPAAWAMMIAGFGLVGGALRRRSQPVSIEVSYA